MSASNQPGLGQSSSTASPNQRDKTENAAGSGRDARAPRGRGDGLAANLSAATSVGDAARAFPQPVQLGRGNPEIPSFRDDVEDEDSFTHCCVESSFLSGPRGLVQAAPTGGGQVGWEVPPWQTRVTATAAASVRGTWTSPERSHRPQEVCLSEQQGERVNTERLTDNVEERLIHGT